jgi:8-oxo-dGTP pyrophosphatase MutT (NUDIX family)
MTNHEFLQNIENENLESDNSLIWISDTGIKYKFTFIDSDSHEKFSPIAQSYGICFDKDGKIAIGRNSLTFNGRWMLPGGRRENGESPEQTLKRELLEELDLTVDKYKLIGAQKVEYPDDVSKKPFYQFRYAVIIKEAKPLTPDPDNGIVWERKFVNPSEVNSYIKWGKILQHTVLKSCEWYEGEKKKQSK